MEVPSWWERERGDGSSPSHGAALMLGRRAAEGMVADTHPRSGSRRRRRGPTTAPVIRVRPVTAPARLAPAHRGARPPRAPRPHVVRRRPRPVRRRVDVRLGDHDRPGQRRRHHLPRPQAGRGRRPSGSTAGRSTSTCWTAAASRSTSPRATHEIVVEATMPFRRDGEGLHRSVDPADGRVLRLRHELHGRGPERLRLLRPARPEGAVHAARDRTLGLGRRSRNAPAVEPASAGDGTSRWDFAPTPPLSTYFVTAGGRALPPDPRRARRHPARPQRPGSASPRRSTRTPTRS